MELPAGVRQKLAQTLAQWAAWQCDPPLRKEPAIVARLGNGISNFSVLVASGNDHFVVRIDGVNPSTNGLNRQCEWRILKGAKEQHLAPAPRYFNPDLGSLVCDYLEHDECQQAAMQEVAQLLVAIHRLPARHHRLDLAERVKHYEKHVHHGAAENHVEVLLVGGKITALLQFLEGERYTPVLCHNDLLQANRVYHKGALYAVDWEYAAMGSPWYDLAVVIHGDGLDRQASEELVSAYLGRPASRDETRLLYGYGCVYRYLEILWYLCQEDERLPRARVSEKLAALGDMLENVPVTDP